MDIGCSADSRERAIQKLRELLDQMEMAPQHFNDGCGSDLEHWKVVENPDGHLIGSAEWKAMVEARMTAKRGAA